MEREKSTRQVWRGRGLRPLQRFLRAGGERGDLLISLPEESRFVSSGRRTPFSGCSSVRSPVTRGFQIEPLQRARSGRWSPRCAQRRSLGWGWEVGVGRVFQEHRRTTPAPFPAPGLATFSLTEAPPVGEQEARADRESVAIVSELFLTFSF